MTEKKPPSDMVVIKNYFGLSAKEAMDEFKRLSATDKTQIAEGIRNETYTY